MSHSTHSGTKSDTPQSSRSDEKTSSGRTEGVPVRKTPLVLINVALHKQITDFADIFMQEHALPSSVTASELRRAIMHLLGYDTGTLPFQLSPQVVLELTNKLQEAGLQSAESPLTLSALPTTGSSPRGDPLAPGPAAPTLSPAQQSPALQPPVG